MQYLYFKYYENPTFKVKMNYGTWKQNIVNTTLFMRNTSVSLTDCTDVAEDTYLWVVNKTEEFNTTNALVLGFI